MLTTTMWLRSGMSPEERVRVRAADQLHASWINDEPRRLAEANEAELGGRESGPADWRAARQELGLPQLRRPKCRGEYTVKRQQQKGLLLNPRRHSYPACAGQRALLARRRNAQRTRRHLDDGARTDFGRLSPASGPADDIIPVRTHLQDHCAARMRRGGRYGCHFRFGAETRLGRIRSGILWQRRPRRLRHRE